MSRILFSLLLFLGLSHYCFATASYYPRGCTPKTVKFYGDYAVLNNVAADQKFRVYVFYNTSYYPVSFQHLPPDKKVSSGLPSTLEPSHWSALLVEQDNFVLSCSDKGGYDYALPCHEVVRVCELAVSPVMLSSQGEYWISENQRSKGGLFSTIRKEGIYP